MRDAAAREYIHAAVVMCVVLTAACVAPPRNEPVSISEPRWLAGDHHVHSRYSVGWDISGETPKPVIGGDSPYSIERNVEMAQRYGLHWMVTTDHDGPQHSELTRDRIYPEVIRVRANTKNFVLFVGMEFDTPGADHTSLIMPVSPRERAELTEIERRFSKRERYPRDRRRDTLDVMLEALRFMGQLPHRPVVIANHPSRSADARTGLPKTNAEDLRAWHDAAPGVIVGMEGAPGHQAAGLATRTRSGTSVMRGSYETHPTLGGFDEMTARVGGVWDTMLAEGRRWWITATSDSHLHWSAGGVDFWPGEYAKTYVLAQPNPTQILESLRSGKVFTSTGDLVNEVWVTISADGERSAGMGEALRVRAGTDVRISIQVRDPAAANHHGDRPSVTRIDVITGAVACDPLQGRDEPVARVVTRFTPAMWQRDGEYLRMHYVLGDVRRDQFLRVRGTNSTELEPAPDVPGEDPWRDLWFYASPVFIEVR